MFEGDGTVLMQIKIKLCPSFNTANLTGLTVSALNAIKALFDDLINNTPFSNREKWTLTFKKYSVHTLKKEREKREKKKHSSVKIVQPQAFVKLELLLHKLLNGPEWGCQSVVSSTSKGTWFNHQSLFFKKEQASCFV